MPRMGAASNVQMMAKSKAMPWMETPAHLEGMVGNAGFDPLGLSTPQNINWMREAELKHGRMCMLAWAVRARPHVCAGAGRLRG